VPHGPIRAATGAATTTRRFGKAAVAAVAVAAALTAGNVLLDLGSLPVERVSAALAAVEAPAPLANGYTAGRFLLDLDGAVAG
jgi:hypothetical protein